jgi:predicted glycoside hydrolase/deacetylase ChbG (UPF0249 family)
MNGKRETVEYQESSIKNQVSRIEYQVSSIKYQVSSIKNQVSRIKYPESKIKFYKNMKTAIYESFTLRTATLWILFFFSILFVPKMNSAQEKVTNAEKLGFQKGKKVLLLHCDDAGMCEEANIAVQSYVLKGDVLSSAVMMPCPYAEEMVKWAVKHPTADVGVHLTLTSEWKKYRWATITDPKKVPGLIDPEGKMWHGVVDVVNHASPKEVETEIHAQIDKMIKLGYKPTHIDTHMGTLYGSPEFAKVFLETAVKYNIPANAIDLSDKEVAENYRSAGYPINNEMIKYLDEYPLPKLDNFTSAPDGKSYEDKKGNFIKMVKALKPGLTEIIFHPSILTENLKSITGSAQQRAWEAQMFSDPQIKQFFNDNDIEITTWTEIMKRFEAGK